MGPRVGRLRFRSIFARTEAQVIRHADSDGQHELVFGTVLLSVLVDDVQNHSVGARQSHARGIWEALDSGFHSNEEVVVESVRRNEAEHQIVFQGRQNTGDTGRRLLEDIDTVSNEH